MGTQVWPKTDSHGYHGTVHPTGRHFDDQRCHGVLKNFVVYIITNGVVLYNLNDMC